MTTLLLIYFGNHLFATWSKTS